MICSQDDSAMHIIFSLPLSPTSRSKPANSLKAKVHLYSRTTSMFPKRNQRYGSTIICSTTVSSRIKCGAQGDTFSYLTVGTKQMQMNEEM